MANYWIEFKIGEYEQKFFKRVVYEVARKFKKREITRKKAVPRITLLGPFTTKNEKKMISELIYIAENYTLIPFRIKGFNYFNNASNKIFYLDIEPSELLKQFRFNLLDRLSKISNMKSPQDKKSNKNFHFHAPIAFNVKEEEFEQIWSNLKKNEWDYQKKGSLNTNQYLLRISVLKNRRFLFEYDLLLKRRLNKIQAISKRIYKQTINSLEREKEQYKNRKIYIKKSGKG